MSAFRECDRCGAKMPFICGYRLELEDRLGTNHYKDNEAAVYDLCVTCTNKLRVFLKSKDIEIDEE